jgi:hypothetical protein
MKKHCCEMMTMNVDHSCQQHPDPFDCPDSLVSYSRRFDEYGLIVHDGGSSTILIEYCPWCGTELPASKRDAYFDELEKVALNKDD